MTGHGARWRRSRCRPRVRLHLLELAAELAPCDRGSGGDRPRSAFRRDRRGSRSRRAGARGGSSCAPAAPPDNRDARARPASRPSAVAARSPKISRISPVRSITLASSAFSRLRCWIGVSAASTTTSSASAIRTCVGELLDLARADQGRRLGLRGRETRSLDHVDTDRARRGRPPPPAAPRHRRDYAPADLGIARRSRARRERYRRRDHVRNPRSIVVRLVADLRRD